MNVIESNFCQEFSIAKELKFLTVKVLCTALIIGKNICLHFRIWTMEKSIEFILDDKLTLGIAIYGYSLGGPTKGGRGSKVRQKAC